MELKGVLVMYVTQVLNSQFA